MKNIHCYIAKDGYAARVKDTKSYDSIRLVIGSLLAIVSPLIQLSAKTSYLDGRSRSFQTITIQPDTRTIISAGTSTSQRTVLLYFLGGFARHVSTPLLVLTRDAEQNMQNRQPDTHRIKEPDCGQRTGRRLCSRATLYHRSGFYRSKLVSL